MQSVMEYFFFLSFCFFKYFTLYISPLILGVACKQLIFVYVEMDNEDFGKPVAEYFGTSGKDPKVIQ